MSVVVARIQLVPVSPTGVVLDKSSPTTTIKSMLIANTEPRIMHDEANANTHNYPTIEDYISLEDAAGRKVKVVNQTMVITQD